MTTSESLAVWLLEHPKLRWVIGAMTGTYVLCLWSVVAAPQASAAVGTAALGWTGLHDTDDVPMADYFLSVVDTSEASINNGQHVSAVDPSTWPRWVVKATQTAMTHSTAAWWLTNEAALVVFAIGIALWFLRFAMSSSWLLALVQIGRPIFATVNTLVNEMWLGPLAIAVCVTLAGFHYQRGRSARAWNLVGTAAVLTALLWTVFRDPINDLVSDRGLLGIGRATGFQIAQDVRRGSYAPGQSLDGQLDALLAQLVSSTARPALQLQNFGMVVDDVGGCRRAWSQAIMAAHGQGPGPAHAMKSCGAAEALTHAQQLGANDFVLGLFFLFAAFSIGLFIWYVGISTLLVGAKAAYYCIIVVPAVMMGMTGWERGKRFALRCTSQVLLHGAEMMIFTVFLALSAVGMGWILTTPQLGHGGAAVVPRLLLVSLGSIVGIFLFHYIDKHFYTDGLGTIAHHISAAWGSASGAVRDDYNDYAELGRRGRRMFGQIRGGRDDEVVALDYNGPDTNAPQSTPGFDVVKSRPSRVQGEETRAPVQARAGRRAAKAGAAEVGGATADGTAAAAAEGAAAFAAPEVVIPAVAAEAATSHMRRHSRHNADRGAEHDSAGARDNGQRATTAANSINDPATGPQQAPEVTQSSDAPASLAGVSGRPAQGCGRPPAAPDEDPDLQINNASAEQHEPVEESEASQNFNRRHDREPRGDLA